MCVSLVSPHSAAEGEVAKHGKSQTPCVHEHLTGALVLRKDLSVLVPHRGKNESKDCLASDSGEQYCGVLSHRLVWRVFLRTQTGQ